MPSAESERNLAGGAALAGLAALLLFLLGEFRHGEIERAPRLLQLRLRSAIEVWRLLRRWRAARAKVE